MIECPDCTEDDRRDMQWKSVFDIRSVVEMKRVCWFDGDMDHLIQGRLLFGDYTLET
jgi:hypothetical protein